MTPRGDFGAGDIIRLNFIRGKPLFSQSPADVLATGLGVNAKGHK